jgi:hypothetical protein
MLKQIEANPFNRATEDNFSKSGKMHFSLNRRRTRLDTNAVAMMKAQTGMFIHFIPFEESWYVAVNDDSRGYKLSADMAGLSVSNTKFVRWFFAKNKITSLTAIYLLLPAENIEWRGVPLFAITRKLTD